MSSGDKTQPTNEHELLSVGEIDARYLKILRMRQDNVVEKYEMRRRFRNDQYDSVAPEIPVATTSELDGGSVKEVSPLELEVAVDITGTGGLKSPLSRPQLGAASRKILQPEDEDQKSHQPKMKKRDRKKSAEEVKGQDKDIWGADAVHREVFVQNTVKDFYFYIVFLIVTNIITFGVLNHAYSYYSNVLKEIVTTTEFKTDLGISKTFNEIRDVQQIWDFITDVLVGVLYDHSGDGADHGRIIRPNMKDKVLTLFENILIGVPRIRQKRVRNDSCKIASVFEDLFPSCFNYYSDYYQDEEPFGLKQPTAWVYAEPDSESASYTGKISTYGGGGYIMNLTINDEYTKNWIAELTTNQWIQQGTRVVFIDFTTYTPNTNLFCVVKLVFELPPTGGVIPTAHFYTLKFLRYVNTWDLVTLACEITFMCYAVYYTMEEIQKMTLLKEEYWYSPWNVLDVFLLILQYFFIILGCIRYVTTSAGIEDKVNQIKLEAHASFDNFVRIQRNYDATSAIFVFFSWIKLLKFASLNKTIALILAIFGRVKFELFSLTLMMFLMIMGFALLGNMWFGTHVEQFSTIWTSMFSLVEIFVGGLHFYLTCAKASTILAPIFFTSYIFMILVLFLNSYVALIVHGFHRATEDFDEQRDRIYLGDIIRSLSYKLLKLIGRRKLANKLRDRARAKANKMEYDELLDIVKKHGYRGLDVTMIMKKHHLAPGNPVPFDKMSQIYNDIDVKNQLLLEVDEHDKLIEEMDEVRVKVDSLGTSMTELTIKVEKLVNELL